MIGQRFARTRHGKQIRDVLIGDVPPASIQDLRYMAVSVVAGVVRFSDVAATNERTSIPKISSLLRAPAIAPLMANAKVPNRSKTVSSKLTTISSLAGMTKRVQSTKRNSLLASSARR